MNVSSIIVKTAPEHLDEVMDSVNALDLCEVHFNDESGRIVVTIEGETTGEEMTRLRQIQGLPHVLSADLVYSYSEEELAEAIGHLKDIKDVVPQRLKE